MLMIMKRLTNTWLSLDNYVLYISASSRGQFHQHFKCSFYAQRSQKCKHDSQFKQLFALLGSAGIKAASKHIDEIDPRSPTPRGSLFIWSHFLLLCRTSTFLPYIFTFLFSPPTYFPPVLSKTVLDTTFTLPCFADENMFLHLSVTFLLLSELLYTLNWT